MFPHRPRLLHLDFQGLQVPSLCVKQHRVQRCCHGAEAPEDDGSWGCKPMDPWMNLWMTSKYGWTRNTIRFKDATHVFFCRFFLIESIFRHREILGMLFLGKEMNSPKESCTFVTWVSMPIRSHPIFLPLGTLEKHQKVPAAGIQFASGLWLKRRNPLDFTKKRLDFMIWMEVGPSKWGAVGPFPYFSPQLMNNFYWQLTIIDIDIELRVTKPYGDMMHDMFIAFPQHAQCQ